METIPIILDNQPIWILLGVIVIKALYADIIKPYLKKKADTKIENEKTKRYNEEKTRWDGLFKAISDYKDTIRYLLTKVSRLDDKVALLITSDTNNISKPMAEKVIRSFYCDIMYLLKERIRKIYYYNNRLNKDRQQLISNSIKAEYKQKVEEVVMMLDEIRSGDYVLSSHLRSIDEESKVSFFNEVLGSMFKPNNKQGIETESQLNDTLQVVEMTFAGYISEALVDINDHHKKNL